MRSTAAQMNGGPASWTEKWTGVKVLTFVFTYFATRAIFDSFGFFFTDDIALLFSSNSFTLW